MARKLQYEGGRKLTATANKKPQTPANTTDTDMNLIADSVSTKVDGALIQRSALNSTDGDFFGYTDLSELVQLGELINLRFKDGVQIMGTINTMFPLSKQIVLMGVHKPIAVDSKIGVGQITLTLNDDGTTIVTSQSSSGEFDNNFVVVKGLKNNEIYALINNPNNVTKLFLVEYGGNNYLGTIVGVQSSSALDCKLMSSTAIYKFTIPNTDTALAAPVSRTPDLQYTGANLYQVGTVAKSNASMRFLVSHTANDFGNRGMKQVLELTVPQVVKAVEEGALVTLDNGITLSSSNSGNICLYDGVNKKIIKSDKLITDFANATHTHSLTDLGAAAIEHSSSHFSQNADKLVKNDTSTSPGFAYIGSGYQGIQSYGEEAKANQFYGKNSTAQIYLGDGGVGSLYVGKDLRGAILIGSSAHTNQIARLIYGSEYVTFKEIIDKVKETPVDTSLLMKTDYTNASYQPMKLDGSNAQFPESLRGFWVSIDANGKFKAELNPNDSKLVTFAFSDGTTTNVIYNAINYFFTQLGVTNPDWKVGHNVNIWTNVLQMDGTSVKQDISFKISKWTSTTITLIGQAISLEGLAFEVKQTLSSTSQIPATRDLRKHKYFQSQNQTNGVTTNISLTNQQIYNTIVNTNNTNGTIYHYEYNNDMYMLKKIGTGILQGLNSQGHLYKFTFTNNNNAPQVVKVLEVPVPSVSDNGKTLKINASGQYELVLESSTSPFIIGDIKATLATLPSPWVQIVSGATIPTNLRSLFGGATTFPTFIDGMTLVNGTSGLGTITSGDIKSHTHTQNSHTHTFSSGITNIDGSSTNLGDGTNSTRYRQSTVTTGNIGRSASLSSETPTINATGGTNNLASGLKVKFYVYGGE